SFLGRVDSPATGVVGGHLPADRSAALGQRAALEYGVGVESDDNGAGVVLPHAAVVIPRRHLLQPLVAGPGCGGGGKVASEVVAKLPGVLLVDGTVGYDGQDNLVILDADGRVPHQRVLHDECYGVINGLLWDRWRRWLGHGEPRDGDGDDETGDDVMPQRPLASWSMDSLG